jgi:hypothetical protein
MIVADLADGRNVQYLQFNMCNVNLQRKKSNHFLNSFYRRWSRIDYGHELVPDIENSQCPENHLVCCKSMVPVASFCMSK